MVVNFEKYTEELTDNERDFILPVLVKVLRARTTKEESITNKVLCEKLESVCGLKTTEPRIRKIINAIRMSGVLMGVVATSKGYYTTNNIEELETYAQSMAERISAMEGVLSQVEFHIKSLKK